MRINRLLLVLFIFTQPALATPKIQHWNTPQGSQVYFVHTQGLPLVDINIAFDAGSARDGEQLGISALTAALLDTGAGEWNADMIAQRFESVGAQFGTGSSRDMAWMSLRTLTQKKLFDKALDTMQVILANPTFSEADFQREKKRTLAGLKHREERPGAIANIAFFKALYGDHPYAHPGAGFIETVKQLTAADLKNFYQRHFVAANAIVIIVGNLDRKQAEATAEKLLSGLKTGKKPQPIPEITLPPKGSRKHIEFPSTQTHVLLGYPGTHRKDPDYFALYVGNHILGGSGLVSQLFKEVREKRGLAYGAYSYFSPLYRNGPFSISVNTRNDQTDQALKVVQDTLKKFIADGPSAAELEAAKKNITGGFALRFDTNSKLTSYVSMIGFYQQPLDYLDTFQQKVLDVSIDDIKDAFKRRIDPKLLQTITVGNTQGGK